MQTKNLILFLSLLPFLMTSCATTKYISYFQDVQSADGGQIAAAAPSEIKIRPKDKISIVISSKDPKLADLFNLPIYSHRVGYTSEYVNGNNNTNNQISAYTVDSDGTIDFPVLGRIRIAGLSREEVADYVKSELVTKNLINDPVVTVEFMNLCVSVLGEVNKPGRFRIDRDYITILDAISMAGDLTIYGEREDIKVLRTVNGQQKMYTVNLCSAEQVYASPVFYLQQDDVIYVEPNKMRARQSTVNGNNVRSASFWISIASFLASVASIVTTGIYYNGLINK